MSNHEIMAFAFSKLRSLSNSYPSEDVNKDPELRKKIIEDVKDATYQEFKDVNPEIISDSLKELAKKLVS